jgi:hypothetical protein
MSTYVEDKIGRYPNLPTSGSRRPDRKPRNSGNNPLLFGEENPDPGDLIGTEEIDYKAVVNFTVPGCYGVDPAGGTPAPPLPVLNISCVDDESSIPNAVFHSDKRKVYSNFCRAAYGNRRTLQWHFDVFGNILPSPSAPPKPSLTPVKPTPRSAPAPPELTFPVSGSSNWKDKMKRRLGLINAENEKRQDSNDPAQYTNWQFKLDWAPKDGYNPAESGDCYVECEEAFATLALSTCGQKGEGKNMMAVSSQFDNGCGTYGYTVQGIVISKG